MGVAINKTKQMELVRDVKTDYQDYSKIREIVRNGYSSLDVIVGLCNARNIVHSRKKVNELVNIGQIERREFGGNKAFPSYKYYVISEKPSYIAALGVQNLGIHQSNRTVKGEGLTYDRLLSFVSIFYNVSKEDILSRKRHRDTVTCRHVFGKIALDNIPLATLKTIGKFLGGRDHSTIINGNTRVRDLNQFDKKFNREYTKLLSFIEKRI